MDMISGLRYEAERRKQQAEEAKAKEQTREQMAGAEPAATTEESADDKS